MLIVLIMWSTTMIGPGKIGASLFNFIYFSWLGMLGFISLSLKNWREYKIKFYFGVSLFFLIIASIFLELRLSFTNQTLYGIFLALAGGTSSFIYFKNSQTLAKKAHLTATQILAVRFYLSVIILFIIVPKDHIASYLSFNNIASLTLLAFLSLVIPLYFSQKALEKISTEQHAIINSLCPIITGILQQITFNDLKKEQMIIYTLYFISIICFYLIAKYTKTIQYK